MENESEEYFSRSKWLIPLLSPALGYLFTFIFEMGKCDYYGIPYYLIAVDISTVLMFSCVGFCILFFLSQVGCYAYFAIKLNKTVVLMKSLALLVAYLFFAVIITIAVFKSHPGEVMHLLLLLVLSVGTITMAIFIYFSHKNELFTNLRHLTLVLFTICLVFFLAVRIPYKFGNTMSMLKKDYLIASTQPESAVLCKYGDLLICDKFDRPTKSFKREFIILNSDRINDIVFKRESIELSEDTFRDQNIKYISF